MEATIAGANGRSYYLLPHERWFVERVRSRLAKRTSSRMRRVFRGGPTAITLRMAGAANSLVIGPMSVIMLIVLIVNEHRWANGSGWNYEVLFVIFVVVVLPFYFLRFRRFIQSTRERREFLAANLHPPSP